MLSHRPSSSAEPVPNGIPSGVPNEVPDVSVDDVFDGYDSDWMDYKSETREPSVVSRTRSTVVPSRKRRAVSEEPAVHPTKRRRREQGKIAPDAMQPVIFIPDAAPRTLEAVIFWMMTGCISFAPLKSATTELSIGGRWPKATRVGFLEERLKLQDECGFDVPPACSPKSAYRLADKYGLAELKKVALQEFMAQIHPQNVLKELASPISAYAECRSRLLDFAKVYWASVQQTETISDFVDQACARPRLANVLLELLLFVRIQANSDTINVGGARDEDEDAYPLAEAALSSTEPRYFPMMATTECFGEDMPNGTHEHIDGDEDEGDEDVGDEDDP